MIYEKKCEYNWSTLEQFSTLLYISLTKDKSCQCQKYWGNYPKMDVIDDHIMLFEKQHLTLCPFHRESADNIRSF